MFNHGVHVIDPVADKLTKLEVSFVTDCALRGSAEYRICKSMTWFIKNFITQQYYLKWTWLC